MNTMNNDSNRTVCNFSKLFDIFTSGEKKKDKQIQPRINLITCSFYFSSLPSKLGIQTSKTKERIRFSN